MQKKHLYILYHIAGCLLFLVAALILYPHPPNEGENWFSRPTQRDFIANLLMLGFFYLNYYTLIPSLYFRKKYLLYIACIVFALGLIVLLPSMLTGRMPWTNHPPGQLPPSAQGHSQAGMPDRFGGPPNGPPPDADGPPPFSGVQPDRMPGGPAGQAVNPSFFEEISHHIFVFFIVVLFSLFLRVRNRMLVAEKKRVDAELNSLKSQINPHFLFNALNSIYSLTVKKQDTAPAAVINLSELMRYMIKDANEEVVPLQIELDYIVNYIELQKARVVNTALVEYNITGDTTGKTIAPLLLIAFIENAFKYGINPDEESSIRIEIKIADDQLIMRVRNAKVVKLTWVKSTGVGIPNTRERLNLLYPGKHTLSIDDNAGDFLVTLTITLQ